MTRWVEENLLRMDRTAFEATFYARQKELRFFAHDDGISRVRRVSRMLGISGVEAAQKLLRDDRNDLRSEARVIEGRLAEADLDELNTGLEAAKAECQRLEEELEKASAEHELAEGERKEAREARAALDAGVPRAHAALQRAAGAEADRRRAEDRAAEAEKDLEELARAEEELGRLRPDLERLPELEAELEKTRRRPAPVGAARAGTGANSSRPRSVSPASSPRCGTRWKSLDDEESDEEPVPGWADLFELDGRELFLGPARCWGTPQEG